MTFVRPLVLLLLIVPVTIAFWEWVRKGHPLVMPFDFSDQKRGRWLRFLVNAANTIPQLLLAVVITILAGPQRLAPPEKERVKSNVLFCLDISSSMNNIYGRSPSRYDAAAEAIHNFISLESREGDTFGLTVFGNEVIHWVPVTADKSAIEFGVKFTGPSSMPAFFKGTQIGKALLACKERLSKQEEGDRLIILLSDGASADLRDKLDLDEVIDELTEAKITVYFIALVGINDQFSMEHKGDVDRIARESGGRVFLASHPRALEETMEFIDMMQKAEFKQKDPMHMDFFKPFVTVGLVLLMLGLLALSGLRYTPW